MNTVLLGSVRRRSFMADSSLFAPQLVFVIHEFSTVVSSECEDMVACLVKHHVAVQPNMCWPFRFPLHEVYVEGATEIIFEGYKVGGSSKTLLFDRSPRVGADEFTNS